MGIIVYSLLWGMQDYITNRSIPVVLHGALGFRVWGKVQH